MADVDFPDLWNYIIHDLSVSNPLLLNGCDVDYENRTVRGPAGSSCRQFAALALCKSIESKYQDQIDKGSADAAAWEVFHAANSACENWRLRVEELGPYDEVVLGEFKKLVYDFFNPEGYPLLTEGAMLPYLDFGPGSAPGAPGTDFISKIGESTLGASSSFVVQLYNNWIKDHHLRLDCEIARAFVMGEPEIISATVISAVPKKRSISRLVKPEPPLNMFFQKGCAGVLRSRIREFFGIDFQTQPQINSELARIGSTDGQYATIDLKSASDYLATLLCLWCIPRSSLLWLEALRSRYAITDRGTVELHMMATMGNDFCFPLQTVIFACAVLAVYRALGLPIRKGGRQMTLYRDVESGEINTLDQTSILPNFGVFGDDIVVLDEAYEPVCRLLRALGFIPNKEKSFNALSGTFRESCGADWIDGFNVRGVYCKTLKTIQDRYALINNLVDWSVRTGIVLPKTIAFLRSTVPDVAVPPWENPDSGIRMPEKCLKETHQVYKCYKAHSGLELHGSYLYKRYLSQPRSRPCSDEVPTEGCFWNSSAVFLAAIKGHCRGGRISIRQWETPYKKRLGVAPCWDYIQPGDPRYKGRRDWYELVQTFGSAQQRSRSLNKGTCPRCSEN